jgi:predicted nucleotidyltransferase
MIDVKPEHLAVVKAILRKRLAGRSVRCFGSRAIGHAKPASDLDLVVMDGLPLSSRQLADLAFDFSDSNLPYRVDIAEWNRLTDDFKKSIKVSDAI